LLVWTYVLEHVRLRLQADNPRTFVLEIGSEELPPQDVTSAISQVLICSPSLSVFKVVSMFLQEGWSEALVHTRVTQSLFVWMKTFCKA
jgi:hypothetical protein